MLGTGTSEPQAAGSPARSWHAADPRFLWALAVLALASRLAWVLWIHPPGDYVYSDMARYVERAQALVTHGFRFPVRNLAWQAYGTHYILSIPLALFGKEAFVHAAVMYAVMGAAAVPVGYLLACRILPRRWMSYVAGAAMLCWYPNLSTTGYFLSEPPFLLFQLWSTLALAIAFQEGRRSLTAGLTGALAFMVRPQAAVFYVLVLLVWWLNRRRLPQVRPKHLVMVAVPLVLMLGFSIGRFRAHTGYWGGVAENANMNLTAGRCHNIVTQAFRSKAHKRRSDRKKSTRDGRRVSLPAFRVLARKYKDDHILGLRPALGGKSIKMVGYIGDPDLHREIRRQCYAQTGMLGQVRYSMINVMLQWFVGSQWPDMERGRKKFLAPSERFKYIYQQLIWFPSLVGIVLVLLRVREHPAGTLPALQLITSMFIASVFFGTIRLRTPYDPYAIILAIVGWAWFAQRLRPIGVALWARVRRGRGGPAAGASG